MAGNTAYPRIWAGFDVYVGPTGTTAPTDVATAWNAAFIPFGLCSDTGLTESREQDETDHYAHGSIHVRTVRSKHKRTFTVIAIEDNKTVFSEANPGSSAVTATGITTRDVKIPVTARKAYGMQLTDGTNIKRIVIPAGEITAVGDKVYSDSEITATEMTLTVYPDSASLLYKEITNDLQAVVP